MNLLTIIAAFFMILGALTLSYSLITTKQIIAALPTGIVSSRWLVLRKLITFFILAYAGFFVFTLLYGADTGINLIAIVFMLGAGFVHLVCQLALITVHDIKRISVLEQESTTDALMGIFNRRYFDDAIQNEFTRARRYQLELSLLVLDIDHFKRCNDNYGHQAGDLVLKAFAQLIQQNTRNTDIVARYGGEEIVVVLPSNDLSAARTCAEKLRACTQQSMISIDQDQTISVTVSIGIASINSTMDSSRELFKQADEALYLAKQSGRNCIRTQQDVLHHQA